MSTWMEFAMKVPLLLLLFVSRLIKGSLNSRSRSGPEKTGKTKMILSQGTKGELWVEVPEGGVRHLGTYHMDKNVFQESEEDGVPGEAFDINRLIDGGWIIIKGGKTLHKEDFDSFRHKWLTSKFPSIDFCGGRQEKWPI